MSIPFKLCLPRVLLDEMIAQAKAELPNECVGLLAGRVVRDDPLAPIPLGKVEKRYPLVNELASPREFTSDSKSLIKAHLTMREGGLEILAVYHSHPTSAPIPSRKDVERNYHGSEVVHFIISMQTEAPQVRAWQLGETDFWEADWVLT